jgi:hypothetical protein
MRLQKLIFASTDKTGNTLATNFASPMKYFANVLTLLMDEQMIKAEQKHNKLSHVINYNLIVKLSSIIAIIKSLTETQKW